LALIIAKHVKKEAAMKTLNIRRCAVCGKAEAVDTCYVCSKALCKKCRKLEVWGTGAEDLTFRNLCEKCKNDPEVNPWGAPNEEFGLGEVLEIIKASEVKQLPMAA